MGSDSKGKERAHRDSSPRARDYDGVFNPPPNSLDFSHYRSNTPSPNPGPFHRERPPSLGLNQHSPPSLHLPSSPEVIATENETEQWNEASWITNHRGGRRAPAGIFGNLAFGSPDSPEEVPLPDHPILTRSTRSSRESSPRSVEYDNKTLTKILESHHNSIIASLRSTIEINTSVLSGRLDELGQELWRLRKDLEKPVSGEVREMQQQLDRERALRKKQAKEHDVEMEHLYRQLSDVL